MKLSILTWAGIVIAAAGWALLLSGPLESAGSELVGPGIADRLGKSPDQIIYLGYMLITWGIIARGFRSLVPE